MDIGWTRGNIKIIEEWLQYAHFSSASLSPAVVPRSISSGEMENSPLTGKGSPDCMKELARLPARGLNPSPVFEYPPKKVHFCNLLLHAHPWKNHLVMKPRKWGKTGRDMCYWVRKLTPSSSSISREVLVAEAASIATLIRERNGLIREEAFLPPISIYFHPITSACFQSILRQVSHDNAISGEVYQAQILKPNRGTWRGKNNCYTLGMHREESKEELEMKTKETNTTM